MTGDGGVDLARLAGAYGHRAEEAAVQRAVEAADAAHLAAGMRAIDVGGGGGRHATVFATRGALALVVDRSPEMAREARDRGVPVVVGDGASLPVADSAADLVYFHLSIHHGAPVAWLEEAVRVVRPGGLVWVWTLSREHLAASFLSRWFPRVASLDQERFPDPDHLTASMRRLGLVEVGRADATEEVQRTAASWTAAVRAGFVSTLHLLEPAEIESGLAGFAASHPDPEELVAYTLGFSRVSGRRASLPS